MKSKYYVNNKEFSELLEDYFETECKIKYEKLGTIFLTIANRIISRPNFINYPIRVKQDMISEATYHMIKYIRSYNTEHKNPFGFFSTIAFNAFKQILNKNKIYLNRYIPLHYIEEISREQNDEY